MRRDNTTRVLRASADPLPLRRRREIDASYTLLTQTGIAVAIVTRDAGGSRSHSGSQRFDWEWSLTPGIDSCHPSRRRSDVADTLRAAQNAVEACYVLPSTLTTPSAIFDQTWPR